MRKKASGFLRFLSIKKILCAIMLIAVTAAGAFLPSAVIEHDDKKIADKIVYIETEKVALETKSNLTVLQKMEAIHSYQPIETGKAKRYTSLTAEIRFSDIMMRLNDLDIISTGYYSEKKVTGPIFYINPAEPDNNFFVWKFKLTDYLPYNNKNAAYINEAIIDDETGEILFLSHTCYNYSCDGKYSYRKGYCRHCDITNIAYGLFGYLNLYALNGDYEKDENIKILKNGAKKYSVLATDGSRESINIPVVIEKEDLSLTDIKYK